MSVHDCLDPESRAQPVSESLQKESSHSLKLFPVVKMENLHKLLPDPSPFGLPSFDLFPRREIDGGSTLPVQDQQLFDKGCDLLGIITHKYTLPLWPEKPAGSQFFVGNFGCLTQTYWRGARGRSIDALPCRSWRAPYQPFSSLQARC